MKNPMTPSGMEPVPFRLVAVSQPIAPLHTPLQQAIVRFILIKFTKLHFKIIQMNTLNKISEYNSILGRIQPRLTHVI
jgi:hypothetical protein